MKKEELIAGKKYRVKSKEWFDANKNEKNQVIENGVIFDKWMNCGKSMVFDNFCNMHGHKDDVELSVKGSDGWWKSHYIPPFALEEDPSDKRTVSKKVYEAIDRLKQENYIRTYDGGPGGGDSETVNTQKHAIIPAFDNDGSEGICMDVSHCKRTFSLARIDELFRVGTTEQRFKATEYTTIRTSLTLIKDKENLPENSSWSTMRD